MSRESVDAALKRMRQEELSPEELIEVLAKALEKELDEREDWVHRILELVGEAKDSPIWNYNQVRYDGHCPGCGEPGRWMGVDSFQYREDELLSAIRKERKTGDSVIEAVCDTCGTVCTFSVTFALKKTVKLHGRPVLNASDEHWFSKMNLKQKRYYMKSIVPKGEKYDVKTGEFK